MKSQKWDALQAMVQYAEGSGCRHADILTYFKDQNRISSCGHCDACNTKDERHVVVKRRLLNPKAQTKKRAKQKKEAAHVPILSEDQAWRVEVLREWRKAYAKENDIPAFIVFSDKTLRDLAIKAPTTIDELLGVYGIGAQKAEALGDRILKVLNGES